MALWMDWMTFSVVVEIEDYIDNSERVDFDTVLLILALDSCGRLLVTEGVQAMSLKLLEI